MTTIRDLQVLEFLTATRIASTRQIQESFFLGLNPSISYDRLKYLADNKFLKRNFYRIEPHRNSHELSNQIKIQVKEYKTDKEQVKKVFVEIQLSKHSVYEKYYNINPNADETIPKYLWVVTDQPQQQHQIRNLRIIVDDLKMTKLRSYF